MKATINNQTYNLESNSDFKKFVQILQTGEVPENCQHINVNDNLIDSCADCGLEYETEEQNA